MRIDTVDGGFVEVGEDVSGPELTYLKSLIAEAKLDNGHLRVRDPSPALVDAVRAVWQKRCPGWCDSIPGFLAHYALRDIVKIVGAKLWSAERAAARRALDARPDIASKLITGFTGFTSSQQTTTVADLLAVDGSCVAKTTRQLDLEAFDRDIERYRKIAVRGERIEASILRWVKRRDSKIGI